MMQAIRQLGVERAEELLVLRGRDDQRVQKITQQVRGLDIPVRLQTRAELYDFLGYHAYEDKLDALFSKD